MHSKVWVLDLNTTAWNEIELALSTDAAAPVGRLGAALVPLNGGDQVATLRARQREHTWLR